MALINFTGRGMLPIGSVGMVNKISPEKVWDLSIDLEHQTGKGSKNTSILRLLRFRMSPLKLQAICSGRRAEEQENVPVDTNHPGNGSRTGDSAYLSGIVFVFALAGARKHTNR